MNERKDEKKKWKFEIGVMKEKMERECAEADEKVKKMTNYVKNIT